jgi:pimeloyl-ACP methyl ester carboxylesterase
MRVGKIDTDKGRGTTKMNGIVHPTGQMSSDRTARGAQQTASGKVDAGMALQKILRVLLAVMKWAAISILALVTGLLITISLFWGPTHWTISLVMAAAWIGLLWLPVFGPGRFGRWRAQLATAVGFVALGLLAVIVSQLSAYTPAIVDVQGKQLPGSIASLEKIGLGGSAEWISIRGQHADNPVLLFLAGGPGESQLGAVRHTLGAAGLEEHFVVVNWEQPGSGKAFDSVDRSKMTPERYVSDAHELTLYLQQRFGQEKVYVVGESWGSALGIMLVQRYPELFYAFMGTGQMVDFTQCDLICYNFALNWAQERGDTGQVAKLRNQGPPPYHGNDIAWKEAAYLLDTYSFMNQNPAIYHQGNTIEDLLSPEYGLYDKINWLRGPLDTLNYVYPQLWSVDFRKQATQLQVPVYFMIGRYDINAPVSLTKDYYQLLQAPHKEIVWFEHSGHTPWVSESGRFVDVIVNKVLKDTEPGR